MAIFNEIAVSLYLYMMIGLGMTNDVAIMDHIGLGLLSILVFTVFINLIKAIAVDGLALI